LIRYDPRNGETTRFTHHDNEPASLTTNFVRATLETKEGAFWVATNMSVDLFDRATGTVQEHFPLHNPLRSGATTGNAYVRLLQDRTGVVWVASARDGLAFIGPANNKITFLSLTSDLGFESGAWAVLEDQFGVLWVGTEHGLLRLDRDRKEFIRYRNDPSDSESLPADWILALYEDREGGVWVGTANASVARFSAHPLPFQRYRSQGRDPFATDYVLFAYEDRAGTVWEGTKGAINQIDLRTGRYKVLPTGENTEVGSITEDRSGQLWVGTFDGSLFRFDPATQRRVV
jgi:ligand-binding sensor domain-containing protein